LLGRFIDEDYLKRFASEKTKICTDAGCEDKAAFFDSLLCFTARFGIGVQVFAHHGITGVFFQVF
jgi:hypothetical protein